MALLKALTAPAFKVSMRPWPADVRLTMYVQPDAPLGFIDLRLDMGRGTQGTGCRRGDDPALHVATLQRLAAHLLAYAAEYQRAAHEDGA